VLPIQRVPRGLNTLLSTFGGLTPGALSEQVIATIDLLQFYGLSQWQTRSVQNAALAEAGGISIDVPLNETWVMYSAACLIAKTATMTSLRGVIQIGPDQGQLSAVAVQEFSPYGANEAGGARMVWVAPYPRVLPGGSRIQFVLDSLAGDANANCLLTASVGVLG